MLVTALLCLVCGLERLFKEQCASVCSDSLAPEWWTITRYGAADIFYAPAVTASGRQFTQQHTLQVQRDSRGEERRGEEKRREEGVSE